MTQDQCLLTDMLVYQTLYNLDYLENKITRFVTQWIYQNRILKGKIAFLFVCVTAHTNFIYTV